MASSTEQIINLFVKSGRVVTEMYGITLDITLQILFCYLVILSLIENIDHSIQDFSKKKSNNPAQLIQSSRTTKKVLVGAPNTIQVPAVKNGTRKIVEDLASQNRNSHSISATRSRY